MRRQVEENRRCDDGLRVFDANEKEKVREKKRLKNLEQR